MKGLNNLIRTLCLAICTAQSWAQETAVAVASHRYEHPGPGDRVLLGANYRKVWSMPVNLKVFHLQKEKGGLIIKGLGGGMQTKSLHLEDKDGTKWVLRSIDKSVERAMEAVGIKDPHIRRMSQRMISAAHPYGAVTILPMAKALGIISTQPELFYVPDDPAFGEHRSAFANTVCLLELREPVLFEGDKVTNTEKMLEHLNKDPSYKIDSKMLLQARLLDMLVGDWDRHDVQWKWEYHPQQDGTTIIYPIARDHDQAYFNSTGVLINMLRPFNMHMVVGFRKSLRLPALNYKAWTFDKSMLKDLKEEDWYTGTQAFQNRLTDSILAEAVHKLPPEVYQASGEHIYELLRIRRNKMLPAVMGYYRFLQKNTKKIRRQERKESEKMQRAKQIKEAD